MNFFRNPLIVLSIFLLLFTKVTAQEETPFVPYDVPSQNLLKFNRFLINPTFSTVREDKSYINLFHRNQSVSFDDNNQTYFLSYSGRMNDRTGLGLSLYTQREGLITNYGVLANYAYGIKLSDKSNFTFGANISYYKSGFDKNRANPIEDDPLLNSFQDSNLLSFQPGFNISYDNFDFGVFAENLIDYNIKTSEMATEFNDKTYSAHLQYTHQFKNGNGIMESSRLMPLARVRKVGDKEVVLGGSLILDLPKLGWVQGGYDSFYGASAGVGFNLGKRLSLGYTMEKGVGSNFDNFGVTHEISFAYSITPTLTEDRVLLEEKEELLAEVEEEKEEITEKDLQIKELEEALASTNSLLDENILAQDSIENSRNADLERRFDQIMRMVARETGGDRADIEEKARQMYFINNDKTASANQLAENNNGTNSDLSTTLKRNNPVVSSKPNYNTKQQKDGISSNATIKRKKYRNLDGVKEGYYVVANVYKGEQYLHNFIDKMTNQGFNANYIDNKNTKRKYAYLEHYNSYSDALSAATTNMNGTYNEGALWIMEVEQSHDSYANEAYAANSETVKNKAADYDQSVLKKNVVSKDKLSINEPKQASFGEGSRGFYIVVNVFANPKKCQSVCKSAKPTRIKC